MSDQQYEQLQLFYTVDELQAKITNVVENMTQAHNRELEWKERSYRNNMQENALEAVKGMRDEVDEESLISIYNTIAEACGWETITALTNKYTVEVTYKGYTIGEFTDIEAEDDDNAIAEVRDNMEVEVTIGLTCTYNGDSIENQYNEDYFDVDDDIEFTAYEVE